jgi:sterol desaturase/sphingolipid hydroxylase (fatty acid hydroxylase superfamily)
MFAIMLTILITFLFSSVFGYVVHWAIHQTWTGKLNNSHMTHHLKLYPPTDYISDKYRGAGKDNTVLIFALVALPVIALPIILGIMGILPLLLVIISLIVMGIISFLHSYLHDAFHVRNHWLYHVPLISQLFAGWVFLHWLHHVNMQTNFGIFMFFLDKLFGTFAAPIKD